MFCLQKLNNLLYNHEILNSHNDNGSLWLCALHATDTLAGSLNTNLTHFTVSADSCLSILY